MKQMVVPEDLLVPYDYEDPVLPDEVRQFKPILYKKEETFHCVLGESESEGISGLGSTEDEAIVDWVQAFRERIQSSNDQDVLVQYIRDTLATSKKNVW